MQKEEQSHLHTHTNTRTGIWSKEKRRTKRMHKRRTSESTHVKSDGIILQKEEHSHAYTSSYWNVAPGKETRKTNAQETHKQMQRYKIRWNYLPKEGHSYAHTQTQNTSAGMWPKELRCTCECTQIAKKNAHTSTQMNYFAKSSHAHTHTNTNTRTGMWHQEKTQTSECTQKTFDK